MSALVGLDSLVVGAEILCSFLHLLSGEERELDFLSLVYALVAPDQESMQLRFEKWRNFELWYRISCHVEAFLLACETTGLPETFSRQGREVFLVLYRLLFQSNDLRG